MSSGAWDGDDFLRVIRKGLHNPTTKEVTDSDILGHYLQKAQVSFASRARFPQLEAYEDVTTVVDQDEYELSSSDVLRINNVQGISDGTMPRLKHCSRDNRIRYGSFTGDPFRWFESSEAAAANVTAVTLVPTPTTAGLVYRVWFQSIPTVVTANAAGEPASVSVFGEQWDLALSLKAMAIGLPLSGRPKEATAMNKAAEAAWWEARKTLPKAPEKKFHLGSALGAAMRRG